MSCELYRGADRYICITGQQIGNAGELVNIDAQIDGLLVELDGAKRANGAKQGAKQGNSCQERETAARPRCSDQGWMRPGFRWRPLAARPGT